MIRRLFWMTLGAVAAYYTLRGLGRVQQARRRLSPSGLGSAVRESSAGTLAGLRDFADTVREGMARRESELREALAADAPPRG
jgi:hypothetical protein